MLLAKAAKIPELQLDEDEAKKLADATANVARHYNISVSQKTLDWSNFVTALSTIYGTRIFVIAKTRQDKKNGAQQETTPARTADIKPQTPPTHTMPLRPYDLPPSLRTSAAVNGTA